MMGKAISGKKKKTQRKKAKPKFAYRRKCSVPPGQHCPQYTRTKQRQKKFRKLRMCVTSEEDTDPGGGSVQQILDFRATKRSRQEDQANFTRGRALVC